MGIFIHTADTHLGYRQYHRQERQEDFFDAFRQVIDAAIDRDADAVIHGGDLFHDSRPATTTLSAALQELRRLADHDIDFLGVVGNHDGTRDAQWLDIFSDLGLAVHLDSQPTVVSDTAFYGLDHVPESKRTQLSYEFPPADADNAVLVAHGLFAPVSPHGTWDMERILGASNIAFDAVLLGDDHTPRIERVTDTVVTYSGATERTATDQTADRSINLVQINGVSPGVQVEQLPLETRQHVFINVELSPGEGEAKIRRELESRPIQDAVVAIIVTGEGETITPAALEEFGKNHGALVVRVSDRRDIELDEMDIDVSFADPDAAVQERIRQMGLSVAAYAVEQQVRKEAIPKSNLATHFETEFDDRIDDALSDFEEPAEIAPPDVEMGDTLARFTDHEGLDTGNRSPTESSKSADKGEDTGDDTEGEAAQLRFDDYTS